MRRRGDVRDQSFGTHSPSPAKVHEKRGWSPRTVLIGVLLCTALIASVLVAQRVSLDTFSGNLQGRLLFEDVRVENAGPRKVHYGQISYELAREDELEHWGRLYGKTKIVCAIPSCFEENRVSLISRTWGRHCDKLLFFVSSELNVTREMRAWVPNASVVKLNMDR